MSKQIVTSAAGVLLLALAALGSSYAQSNSSGCTNRLIAGNFGFTLQGTKLAGPGPTGPQVGVAMTHFDGKGGLTQTDTVTIDGDVVADFTHTPATGTYAVNPDCTGTFTIDFTDGRPTVVANFVVVENGNELAPWLSVRAGIRESSQQAASGNDGLLFAKSNVRG
jgi:hypothetical protein